MTVTSTPSAPVLKVLRGKFPKKPAHVERTVIEPRMKKPKLSSDGSILGGSEGQGATNALGNPVGAEPGVVSSF